MPNPLTWDTPGLTFDSGLTWDGEAATSTNKKTMNKKAIINFEDYTDPELSPVAQNIHNLMVTNAATFTTPPVTMVALQGLIDAYDGKLSAKASRAKADTLAATEARTSLEDALGTIGNYVNTVAKGSAVIVEKSGFPSYETTHPRDTSPPSPPADLKLVRQETSGHVLARYKPDRQPSTNEVQTNTGDPNIEANWHTVGIFKGGRALLTGLPPGVMVWVRVRTVGLQGVMGAWSDSAQIRVV